MTNPSSIDQVLVLRCWRESELEQDAGDTWRIQVSDVNTRDRTYVTGIENALDLVRDLLARTEDSDLNIPGDRQEV